MGIRLAVDEPSLGVIKSPGGVAPDFQSPICGNLERTVTPGLPGYLSYFSFPLSDADVLHSNDLNTAIQAALKQ